MAMQTTKIDKVEFLVHTLWY